MQFEKEVDEDPFGLNKFLTEAKKAKRPAETSRFVVCVNRSILPCHRFSYSLQQGQWS